MKDLNVGMCATDFKSMPNVSSVWRSGPGSREEKTDWQASLLVSVP